jgi:uncharacterized damage-inducible protein DinB
MLLPIATARELLRFMEWADARTWAAVLGSAAASADGTVRSYLLHIHTVQQAFLAMWKSEPVEPLLENRPADFADAAALREWAKPYYEAAHGFMAAVDDAAFSRQIVMPWVSEYERQLGMSFAAPTLSETAFQVVNHTTHHRGQVLARLRALGAEPPLVDYIAWVWFGKPAAVWERPPAMV